MQLVHPQVPLIVSGWSTVPSDRGAESELQKGYDFREGFPPGLHLPTLLGQRAHTEEAQDGRHQGKRVFLLFLEKIKWLKNKICFSRRRSNPELAKIEEFHFI